jgi:hypothetical protein
MMADNIDFEALQKAIEAHGFYLKPFNPGWAVVDRESIGHSSVHRSDKDALLEFLQERRTSQIRALPESRQPEFRI